MVTCQYSIFQSEELNRKRVREVLAPKEELENPETFRTAVINQRTMVVKKNKIKKSKKKYTHGDEE